MNLIRPIAVLALICLGGCATQHPVGYVTILGNGLQRAWPDAGPYGAISDKRHAVGIRIWDANFQAGFADCTIWVNNNGNQTLTVMTDSVKVWGAQDGVQVFGRSEMLAKLSGETEGKSIWSSLAGCRAQKLYRNHGIANNVMPRTQ